MPLRLATLAVCFLGTSILSGCAQVARVSECERFVELANRATGELGTLDAPNQILPAPLSYERLALRFTRFAEDLASLRLSNAELADAAAAIADTMRGAARDCRQYARELREHERIDEAQASARLNVRRKLSKTRARAAQSARAYKGQVARIDRICQPR